MARCSATDCHEPRTTTMTSYRPSACVCVCLSFPLSVAQHAARRELSCLWSSYIILTCIWTEVIGRKNKGVSRTKSCSTSAFVRIKKTAIDFQRVTGSIRKIFRAHSSAAGSKTRVIHWAGNPISHPVLRRFVSSYSRVAREAPESHPIYSLVLYWHFLMWPIEFCYCMFWHRVRKMLKTMRLCCQRKRIISATVNGVVTVGE